MQNQWECTLKNGKSVVVRQATSDDAPAYLEYIGLIFQDDRFFLTTYEESKEFRTLEKTQERITKFQDPSQGILLLAWDGNTVIAMTDIIRGEKLRIRHVGEIGVSILPDYRNLGLGTALMRTWIDWAKSDAGLEKLMLSVYENNSIARRLYEKLGFVEEGRRRRHYKFADNQYIDSIQMSKFVK
jgi:RimJ/RimL family protein N-acetyltransferase